jgi:hypothetical protein
MRLNASHCAAWVSATFSWPELNLDHEHTAFNNLFVGDMYHRIARLTEINLAVSAIQQAGADCGSDRK